MSYDLGRGVPQDYKTAVKWFRLAAEQGDTFAQSNLGAMYQYGEGVPQDYNTAVKWYRLAAEQGNAFSQYNLGLMYRNGQGVPQDYKTAVKWYTLAAEQGYASAQRDLTLIAEQGNARADTPKIILRPKPWDMVPNKDVKTDRKDLNFVSEYREIIREVFRQRSLPKLIELIGDKELEFGPRKKLLRDKYWHEVFSPQFTKEITENTDRHNFEEPRLVAGREGLYGFVERGTCGPECFVRLFFDCADVWSGTRNGSAASCNIVRIRGALIENKAHSWIVDEEEIIKNPACLVTYGSYGGPYTDIISQESGVGLEYLKKLKGVGKCGIARGFGGDRWDLAFCPGKYYGSLFPSLSPVEITPGGSPIKISSPVRSCSKRPAVGDPGLKTEYAAYFSFNSRKCQKLIPDLDAVCRGAALIHLSWWNGGRTEHRYTVYGLLELEKTRKKFVAPLLSGFPSLNSAVNWAENFEGSMDTDPFAIPSKIK